MTDEGSEAGDSGGVTLAYEPGTRVDSVVAACFGEGAIRFGYAVRTGSSWTGDEAVDMACDGSEIEIPVSASADAVRFHALLEDGAGAVLAAAVSGG